MSKKELKPFACNMSDQQFAELLKEKFKEQNAKQEEMMTILNKKVISAVDDLGSKDHSSAITEVLEEKFEKQNAKQEEMMKMLNEKVISAVDDLGSKDQSSAGIKTLKEMLDKQSASIKELREELKGFITIPTMDAPLIGEEHYGLV